MNEDDLWRRLHDLGPAAAEIDPVTVDPATISRSGRRRRLGRWSALVSVAAVIAAGIAVPVTRLGGTSTARVSTVGTVPGIPTASELTLDGMPARACGGIAPLSVLTATGGAENADTPAAAALRRAIAADPSTGYAPPTPHNWVLVADQDGDVTFGQRAGAVGFDATIVVRKNKNGGYSYERSGLGGGCGPIGYADGSHATVLDGYTVAGDMLTLYYTGGDSPDGICDSGPPSVHVFEHGSAVDLLAVLPPYKGPAEGFSCDLVGIPKSVTVQLTTALVMRLVRNVGYVPPEVIHDLAAGQRVPIGQVTGR